MSKSKREQINLEYAEYSLNLFPSLNQKTIKTKSLSIAWLQNFQSDPAKSLCSITALLLESCDIKLERSQIFENLEDFQGLKKIVIQKSREISSFPIMNSKKSGLFLGNLRDFFYQLVRESAEILKDLGICTQLLINFTRFSVRPLRYVSVISILQMLCGFIDEEKRISEKIGNRSGLSEVNNNFSQRNKEMLKGSCSEDLEYIRKEIKTIMKEVVFIRYQDVMYEIKLQCIRTFPSIMSTKYEEKLKNLVLTLTYDKKSDVRMQVLKFILEKSESFIDLKPRMLEMCFDAEDKCCALAIEILTQNKSALSPEEKFQICELAWVESALIRESAYKFIVSVIFNNTLPTESSETIGIGLDQGKFVSIEKAVIDLINFFQEKARDLHKIDYFVAGLWHKTSAMRSCDAMCDLLSRGGSRSMTSELSLFDRIVLANILTSVCKFLSESSKYKPKLMSFSGILIARLSKIITFYKKDQETLKELVKIPAYLDLSCLSSTDLKEKLSELVQTLISIFFSNNDSEILAKIGGTLVRLSKTPHLMQKECKSELVKVIDTISKPFSFKKLPQMCAMLQCKDICDEFPKSFCEDLKSHLKNYPVEVVGIAFYWHMWALQRSFHDSYDFSEYQAIRDLALLIFTKVIDNKSFEHSRILAFKYLCETLFLISGQKAYNSGKLYYEITSDIWTCIETFMIYSYLPKSEEEKCEEAEDIAVEISRILVSCNSVTNSHLSSSFLAFYGRSQLKVIKTIVFQVLNNFKNKDLKKESVFTDDKVLLSIIFQSIVKVLCKGSPENIKEMNDLASNFSEFVVPDPKNRKNCERFLNFVREIIDFSFTDPKNFAMLELLPVFVKKSWASDAECNEIYEHLKFYADCLSLEQDSLTVALDHMTKLLGIQVAMNKMEFSDDNSEKSTKRSDKNEESDEEFVRPKIFKAARNANTRKMSDINKKKYSVTPRSDKKRKKRESYLDGDDGIEEPYGKTRRSAMKKKIK